MMPTNQTINSIKDRVTVSNIPSDVRRAYSTYDTLLAKSKKKKLSLAEQKQLHDAGTATLLFERSVKHSRIKTGKRYDQMPGVK
jgi:hypothetical protein